MSTTMKAPGAETPAEERRLAAPIGDSMLEAIKHIVSHAKPRGATIIEVRCNPLDLLCLFVESNGRIYSTYTHEGVVVNIYSRLGNEAGMLYATW